MQLEHMIIVDVYVKNQLFGVLVKRAVCEILVNVTVTVIKRVTLDIYNKDRIKSKHALRYYWTFYYYLTY